MGNKLTFEDEIVIPSLKYASIETAAEINDSLKFLTIVVRFYGDDDVFYPEAFRLRIGDDRCEAIEINDNPGTTAAMTKRITVLPVAPEGELPPDMRVDARVSTAFEQVMGAYMQASAIGQNGNNAILAKLAELDLIPAGTVS